MVTNQSNAIKQMQSNANIYTLPTVINIKEEEHANYE